VRALEPEKVAEKERETVKVTAAVTGQVLA
jgi:hypothetical protein